MTDDDADAESRELAVTLAGLMRLMTDHRIVDAKKVQEIATYQHSPDGGEKGDVRALIAAAKENYFRFRQAQARRDIDRAISLIEGQSLDRDSGPAALDAYLTRALIAVSAGNKEEAGEGLRRALAIDPLLDISDVDYPPRIVERFAAIKKEVGEGEKGTLAVKSRPAGADVYINGIMHGVTPLELTGLPVGDYSLCIAANRYVPEKRSVTIMPDDTVKVKSKLEWDAGSNDTPGSDEGDEIRTGLGVARALKVDKLILLDADAGGGGSLSIRARVVDRSLKAGLKPIVFPDVLPEYSQNRLAEMAGKLAWQLNADPLSDPEGMIDPVGEGDPVILGKRKKPITRRPLFWGAIGVVVAGAIAGGIAAAMSSGGSERGNVKVSFK